MEILEWSSVRLALCLIVVGTSCHEIQCRLDKTHMSSAILKVNTCYTVQFYRQNMKAYGNDDILIVTTKLINSHATPRHKSKIIDCLDVWFINCKNKTVKFTPSVLCPIESHTAMQMCQIKIDNLT